MAKGDQQTLADMTSVADKSRAEVAKGLSAGPFSRAQLDRAYGRGRWRPMLRFGVWQKGKLRPCDDARSSGTNDGTSTCEKMACERADFPARVARQIASEFSSRELKLRALKAGTDDLADAYRHVPCADPRFSVVAVAKPGAITAENRVEYFTMAGFNFGLKSAVPSFNRFPEATTAIARQLFSVVCSHYFDDFVVVEPASTASSGQEVLRGLMALLNFPFAAAKAVDVRDHVTFLGVETDLSFVSSGEVVVAVSASRKRKLADEIEGILKEGYLSGARAASLCGKLQFTLTWAFGKLGRACMRPIYLFAAAHGGELPREVRTSLEYLWDILPDLPARRVPLGRDFRPPILVWTDGAFENQGRLQDVGFLVLTPLEGAPSFSESGLGRRKYIERYYSARHGRGSVPEELRRRFCVSKQKINQVELVAALLPYLTFPGEFAGRPVLHWIDNTAALAALTKGYSKASDSAHLVHAFHAWVTTSLSSVWFEWVKSAANPADEPSRDLDLASSPWHIASWLVSEPVDPVFPSLERLKDAKGWVKEAAAARERERKSAF